MMLIYTLNDFTNKVYRNNNNNVAPNVIICRMFILWEYSFLVQVEEVVETADKQYPNER